VAGAGPPPKPQPARRNARVGPRLLPAEGRQGAPPSWPLAGRLSAAERTLWGQLWATPQSAEWERLGWTRVVARYCRVALAAESLEKDAMSEARQLEDRLGLSPKSMRMLLWEIAVDEVAEKRSEDSASTARGRIKAVG
jgi:hypothetical protein